jgi:asparagine synthase (glutamine-hydrolysing)
MNPVFIALATPSGDAVPDAVRTRYDAPRGCGDLALRWVSCGPLSVLLGGSETETAPMISTRHALSGVGVVRLDNRADVARSLACDPAGLSDLDLILEAMTWYGERQIPTFLGDFAAVVWDPRTAKLLAFRDAFGARTLYYSYQPEVVAFASRARLLATGGALDPQYFAELVGYCPSAPERTPYAGVVAVPAASILRFHRGHFSSTQYWTPYGRELWPMSERAAPEWTAQFRDLHAQAVSARLTDRPGDVWSLLSGGLDSSSVVSMAQWLAGRGAVPHGLAGTISWVDTHSYGNDERIYSRAVADHYGVRNEQLIDFAAWIDEDVEPPLVDEPNGRYPFHSLDQRTAALVRDNGGHVLLTGLGGDHLVLGTMFFFADWVARGRIVPACREMLRRAALGRVSFWELAFKNAALPLLPTRLRSLVAPRDTTAPAWISPAAIRRYDLKRRSWSLQNYAGRIGHKYADAMADVIASLQGRVHTFDGLVHELLDTRHPYLYRPLVEFALQLPPEMCVHPQQRKWVLREAMRGILPETVRTRIGKGVANGDTTWWLLHRRDRVDQLLRTSMLAELGCIDVAKLRAAIERPQHTDEKAYLDAYHTLSVEYWLHVWSGRWTAGARERPARGDAARSA